MPIKSGMENVKMTTVGRGRGWSANVDPGVLRRPGELLLPVADTDMESLMSAVQALNLQEPSASVSTLQNFDEQLRALCVSADMLRNLVHRLHDRSLEDRQFGKKAATACGFANTFEVDDVKMRALFLAATQKDYEEYAQLQTSNNAKFLNSVALLGEIFHRVRLNDGSPISVLATPIMHYQDILLSGEEHEMELFTTLLSVNGRKLLECCPSELEELLLRVRSVLMSRNLSGQCRCWLLLALDLAANRFGPLPAALQGFYQVHLGSTALSQLQRIDAGLTVETGSSPFSHSLLQTRPSEPPPLRSPRSPLTRANSVPNKTPPASVTNKSPPSSVTNKTPFFSVSTKMLVTTKPPPEEEVQVVANNVEHRSKHNSEEKSWRDDGGGPRFRIGISGRSNSFKSPTEKTGKKFTFTTGGSSGGSREEPGSWRSEAGRGKEPSADEKWGGSKSQGWGHDDRFEKDESFYGKQEPRTGSKGGGSSRGGGGDAPKFTRLSSSGSGGGNFKGRDRQPPVGAKPKNDIPPNFDVIPPSSTEQENWD